MVMRKSTQKNIPKVTSSVVKRQSSILKYKPYPGVLISDGKKEMLIHGEKEEQTIDMNVAQYPVEQGEPLVTHSQYDQNEVIITGYVMGKDLSETNDKANVLIDWQIKATILKLKYGVNDSNFLIKSFKKTYADGLVNATAVEITLIRVRLPTSSHQQRTNSGKQQPSKLPEQTYVTVKPGNTYWGWSMQYGTSIPQLREWNKYPDRFIPIGVRVRVR